MSHSLFVDIDSPAAMDAIARFVAEAARALASADPAQLDRLSHPGNSEQGQRNATEFHRLLVERGYRIVRWTARPYAEPAWKIMREYRFSPDPVYWVDAVLDDGRGSPEYEMFFALAPTGTGELRSCYYVPRPAGGRGRSGRSR